MTMQIDGRRLDLESWAVLSPTHISRNFESGAAALFEAMTLRSIVVGLESMKDYTITVRQSTVHVRVR